MNVRSSLMMSVTSSAVTPIALIPLGILYGVKHTVLSGDHFCLSVCVSLCL
jgi:hypothetical protein